MKLQKDRFSNIEFLRIVCMLMILWIHTVRQLGDYIDVFNSLPYIFVRPLFVASVPTFCLISGYFGIRLSWRKIVKFVSLASFYSVGLYGLSLLLGRPLHMGELVKSLFTISSGGNVWFVQQYFLLMLLSPLINVLFRLPKKELTQMFVLYSFVVFYYGFFRHHYGRTGFDTQMLIYCYFAGHMIKLYEDKLQEMVRYPITYVLTLTIVIGG